MKRNTHDRGLFCAQLEWLLCCSSKALGQGGTMAAVVSAIERGGASGGGEDANYSMLRRVGFAEDEGSKARENVVARERQLARRFALVATEDRRIALARYLLRPDSKIAARFGVLGGVALYLWVTRAALERELQRRNAEQAATQALTLAAELEHAAYAARAAMIAALADSAARLRHRSRWWLLAQGSAAARVEAAVAQRHALALAESPATMEDDARALASACTRGDLPLFPDGSSLEDAADKRCRAAHDAWRETAKQEAKRWADGEDEVAASPAH